ncbi:MAG: hypothetical protein KDA58_07020 [Planctomycetaceae bacterium]|nr:hypothetical protein [Planctomycetaceae bacterium]
MKRITTTLLSGLAAGGVLLGSMTLNAAERCDGCLLPVTIPQPLSQPPQGATKLKSKAAPATDAPAPDQPAGPPPEPPAVNEAAPMSEAPAKEAAPATDAAPAQPTTPGEAFNSRSFLDVLQAANEESGADAAAEPLPLPEGVGQPGHAVDEEEGVAHCPSCPQQQYGGAAYGDAGYYHEGTMCPPGYPCSHGCGHSCGHGQLARHVHQFFDWFNPHGMCTHPPDYGFRPPVKQPIYRRPVAYQQWYPQQWNAQQVAYQQQSGYGQAPQTVYWPTDTTQLGYYYQQVPQWRPSPGMIPGPPQPKQWHQYGNCGDCQDGHCQFQILGTAETIAPYGQHGNGHYAQPGDIQYGIPGDAIYSSEPQSAPIQMQTPDQLPTPQPIQVPAETPGNIVPPEPPMLNAPAEAALQPLITPALLPISR